METTLTRSQFVRWRTAIFAIFLLSGLSLATWASRVPAIKDALDLSTSQLGLLLFVGGLASLIGLSTSPILSARLGSKYGMLTVILTFAVGVAIIGIGANVASSVAVLTVGIVLWGFGNGSVDVMMNVEGAAIEAQSSRTLLPLFHAFFSFGTVIGAGLGALAIAIGFNVVTHTAIIAALIVVVAFVAIANVPRRERKVAEPVATGDKPSIRERLGTSLSAWREPRTYAIGAIMLGMSFAEGGANDWLALGVTDGHGAPQELGAIGLATFSVTMTIVRIFGGPLVDRFGRVLVLRVLSVTAIAGLLLFILAPSIPLVLVGAALWGAGASLGFPLGMSAAGDDPENAAARVSAAASIGYTAFLAGPPLLGFISDHIGVLNTLYIVAGLIVISGLASGAAKPLPGATVGRGH